MKSLKSLLLLSFFALSLTSCKKAPMQVLENKNNYNQNKQVSDFEIKYCDLKSLKRTDISRIRYDNLSLPKEICLDSIKGIYMINGRVPKDCLNNKKKVMDEFSLEESLQMKKEEMAGEKALTHQGESYLCIMDSGLVSYIRNNNKELPEFDESNADFYYMNNKKDRNVSFVKEIIEQAKKDDKKSLRPKNLEYIPKYVAVAKKDNQVLVQGTYGYKGMELLNSYTVRKIKGHISPAKYEYINSIYSTNKEIVLEHYFQTSGCEIRDTKEVRKVVSLDSAIHIVSNKLSGFKKVNIREIVPVYMCLKEDTCKEFVYSAGKKLKFRPVYLFKIKSVDDKKSFEESTYVNLVVDMVTGEYFDDLAIRGK